MGKCVLNQKWCLTYNFVMKVEDKYKVFFKVVRNLLISERSHEKSEKHKQNLLLILSKEALKPPPPTFVQSTND